MISNLILGLTLDEAINILKKLTVEYKLIETKGNNAKFDEYLHFKRVVKISKKDNILDIFYSEF